MIREEVDGLLTNLRRRGQVPMLVRVGEDIWGQWVEEIAPVMTPSSWATNMYNGVLFEKGNVDPAGVSIDSESR